MRLFKIKEKNNKKSTVSTPSVNLNWEDRILKYIDLRLFVIALVVCGFLILFVVGAYFVNFHGIPSRAQDVWGQFGDYVGGVLNPLLSFITIFILLLTIFLQRKQVSDTKRQFDESVHRAEQAEKEIRRQRFESAFFELLKAHSAIVNGTRINQKYKGNQIQVENRECYKVMHDYFFQDYYFDVCCTKFVDKIEYYLSNPSQQMVGILRNCIYNAQSILNASPSQFNKKAEQTTFGQAVIELLNDKNKDQFYSMLRREMPICISEDVYLKSDALERLDLISEAYSAFYSEHGFLIGHYFRSLFHILNYISEGISDDEFYIDMFRAQLSSYELVMLFYNCLSSLTSPAFNKLIDHYKLLKDLDKQEFIHASDLTCLWNTKNEILGILPKK